MNTRSFLFALCLIGLSLGVSPMAYSEDDGLGDCKVASAKKTTKTLIGKLTTENGDDDDANAAFFLEANGTVIDLPDPETDAERAKLKSFVGKMVKLTALVEEEDGDIEIIKVKVIKPAAK